jgi:hypothetical protein
MLLNGFTPEQGSYLPAIQKYPAVPLLASDCDFGFPQE